jgi:CRISPR/Cas system-associated endonuclease Cas1
VIDEEQLLSLENAGATIRKVPGSKSAYSEDQKPRFDIKPLVERAVVERPELTRSFAIAMARSAIHATERIAASPGVPHEEARSLLTEQRRLFGRLEKSGPNGFLTYEALIMKEYWKCFNLPLRFVFERFGPRKRSRFVRESVTTASGRARGYSAVDAAINYLHQRRLFKCRQANMRLGLDYNPGEGFLHRRRWNSDGLGFLLDLIDPFKFADREHLLEAVSNSRINWRDFYSSTDRRGMRFYYPKPEAIGTLEAVGEEADRMVIDYAGEKLPLMKAYQCMVSDLIESLKTNEPHSFTPFEY